MTNLNRGRGPAPGTAIANYFHQCFLGIQITFHSTKHFPLVQAAYMKSSIVNYYENHHKIDVDSDIISYNTVIGRNTTQSLNLTKSLEIKSFILNVSPTQSY